MSVDEPRGVCECSALRRWRSQILVLSIYSVPENVGLPPKPLVFCDKILEVSNYSAFGRAGWANAVSTHC